MNVCLSPVLVVRACAEIFLLGTGLYVSRRDPTAGLLLIAAACLGLLTSLGFPLVECLGFAAISWGLSAGQGSAGDLSSYFALGMMTLAFLGPIGQAFNLMLIAGAVARLGSQVPVRADLDTHATF